MKKKKSCGRLLLFLFLLVLGLFAIIPVGMTLWVSIWQEGGFTIEKYKELFGNCFIFYRMFWNSVLYAFCITFGAIIIGIPAAFGLRFAKFPGKRFLYVLYIVLMMMPLQVMLLPNYIGLRSMKLLNTPYAIILPLLFSPLCVVILYQYMRECNAECVEAARLETSSVLRIILRCILPEIKVCLFAVALLIFAESWNLVEQPLLYLDADRWKNLSLLFSEPERYRRAVLEAAGVVFMFPVLLWYLMFHKELNSVRLDISGKE